MFDILDSLHPYPRTRPPAGERGVFVFRSLMRIILLALLRSFSVLCVSLPCSLLLFLTTATAGRWRKSFLCFNGCRGGAAAVRFRRPSSPPRDGVDEEKFCVHEEIKLIHILLMDHFATSYDMCFIVFPRLSPYIHIAQN